MSASEDKLHKEKAAQIFQAAISHLKHYDWQGKTMDLLLSVTPNQIWPQPIAVLMFSALYNALEDQTLSQFDKKIKSKQDVINLFEKVIQELNSL